jgi:hypothetical protein
MMRRGLPLLAAGLLGLGLWLAQPTKAVADDQPMRLYHWPFQYYPQTYWPNQVKWPDPRQQFQLPPTYMSYPLQRDNWYRYEILENRRYYRGHHFFLDQF